MNSDHTTPKPAQVTLGYSPGCEKKFNCSTDMSKTQTGKLKQLGLRGREKTNPQSYSA